MNRERQAELAPTPPALDGLSEALTAIVLCLLGAAAIGLLLALYSRRRGLAWTWSLFALAPPAALLAALLGGAVALSGASSKVLAVTLGLAAGALRLLSGGDAGEFVFQKPDGGHWRETDWRNYRSRHFVPALERVEAGWGEWRAGLDVPDSVRESVAGLSKTRPYDLGRHTHSALMLASGMTLQRLARIQGHSIRVLDETYSEQLAEYEDRPEAIDPAAEIEAARRLVWGELDPSTGEPR